MKLILFKCRGKHKHNTIKSNVYCVDSLGAKWKPCLFCTGRMYEFVKIKPGVSYNQKAKIKYKEDG